MRLNKALSLFVLTASTLAHNNYHDQVHYPSSPRGPTWVEKYGPQIDQPFSGPLSFSHLPYVRCLQEESTDFDIAVLGLPFDTAVSYRPGYLIKTNSVRNILFLIIHPLFSARFGPYAIRSGSRRQRESRGYSLNWGNDPYAFGHKIIDCGDVSSNALSISGIIK